MFGEFDRGSGPLVVLLHGWGRSSKDFLPLIELTRRTIGNGLEDCSFLRLDLPGFGISPPPKLKVGTAWYASVVAEAIREIQMEGTLSETSVVVIGHSFGGRILLQLPSKAGFTPGAAIFTGVPLLSVVQKRQPKLAYKVVRRLAKAGVVSKEMLESAKKKYGSADYRAAEGVMREVHVSVVNERYEDELLNFLPPSWLVWGADDVATPPEIAERAREYLPRATLTLVPGSGHNLPLENPEVLAKSLSFALRALSE